MTFTRRMIHTLFLLTTLTLLLSPATQAQTTAFTYQGKLTDAGNPANGNYDLQFKLFDTLAGGAQQGATLVRNPVAASVGIFTVTLDFGATVFGGGADRYLEIGVRPAGSASAYTVLAPRQPLTSSPYSIRTLSAAKADVALNANKLGGVDASEYVTTTSIGSTFVKNDTAQQTGNFNLSGNGLIGGILSVGTNAPASRLAVQTATGNYGLTHTDGATTVGTYVSSAAGWLGTKSNHPLYFFTGNSLAQMTLTTAGKLGLGTTDPIIGKLHVLDNAAGAHAIFGQSLSGRGVWGRSTSHRGIQGDSESAQGVYGTSTSSSGVYGETAVSSLTAAGVYGKGTGSGSIGVIGEANVANATGVYGVSTSPAGVAVYARNNSGGRAIYAEGNVAQALSSNGLVKAMAFISGGVISRCYNSVTNSSSGNCGFTAGINSINGQTITDVGFGFKVNDRFISITEFNFPTGSRSGVKEFPDAQTVQVWSGDFWIFVY